MFKHLRPREGLRCVPFLDLGVTGAGGGGALERRAILEVVSDLPAVNAGVLVLIATFLRGAAGSFEVLPNPPPFAGDLIFEVPPPIEPRGRVRPDKDCLGAGAVESASLTTSQTRSE